MGFLCNMTSRYTSGCVVKKLKSHQSFTGFPPVDKDICSWDQPSVVTKKKKMWLSLWGGVRTFPVCNPFMIIHQVVCRVEAVQTI